jgi:hypothetical protein
MKYIFLRVGLMAIFCGVAFFSGFLFYWCVFCCSSFVVWCGVARLLVEFLRVLVSPDLTHATGCKHPRLTIL